MEPLQKMVVPFLREAHRDLKVNQHRSSNWLDQPMATAAQQRKKRGYCLPDPHLASLDAVIMQSIVSGSRVIDLGCGDGRLMQRLHAEHACDVLGVEVDPEGVESVMERGLAVINADLDEGLQDIPSDSFDFSVLSQTLQQIRRPRKLVAEMMRIAPRGLIVIPNFGYWKVRLQCLLRGRAPITENLPYEWYETPNLHFMSLSDFRSMLEQMNVRVVTERPIVRNRAMDGAWASNLRADSALYVVERKS